MKLERLCCGGGDVRWEGVGKRLSKGTVQDGRLSGAGLAFRYGPGNGRPENGDVVKAGAGSCDKNTGVVAGWLRASSPQDGKRRGGHAAPEDTYGGAA